MISIVGWLLWRNNRQLKEVKEIYEKQRRIHGNALKQLTGKEYILNDGGITCLTCLRTSYNQNDIKNLYCGHCHKFHDREWIKSN